MAKSKRRDEALSHFVERFALTLSEAGFPRMPARVFVGVLIADGGRRTAPQLAEMLRVSPAAISGAVRYLIQVGLLHREREPGSRADHYRLADDLWYESLAHKDLVLTRLEAGLAEGIAALGLDTAAGTRLDETRRFFEFVRGEYPALMAKWRALRGTPT